MGLASQSANNKQRWESLFNRKKHTKIDKVRLTAPLKAVKVSQPIQTINLKIKTQASLQVIERTQIWLETPLSAGIGHSKRIDKASTSSRLASEVSRL